MKTYAVEFTKSAQKELSKLPHSIAVRIVRAIVKLSTDPRKGPVRPMVAIKSWRLRVGDYRVIYDIADDKLVILIIRIKHRKDVYKR